MTNRNARMPTLFIGHGSPMNALQDNRYTQAWRRIGQSLPRPRAILVVSAHWYVPGVSLTAMDKPRTIHDFHGFPQELSAIEYPASGSPSLAAQVGDLLRPLGTRLDRSWGLDHGAWSVLLHLFPEADIPTVQLSIDRSQPPQFHFDLGRRLAPLRDDGILILGSGNVVHNLGLLRWEASSPAYDWAARLESAFEARLLQRDHAALVDWERLDPQVRLAVPSAEHYLPLLYVIGAQHDDDAVAFPVDGIETGSLSMLAVTIGQAD